MGAPLGRDDFDYKHAFWMATVGGAQVLGLAGAVGRLELGHAFDACLVDVGAAEAEEDLGTAFEKFVHLGDDRNFLAVWVQGRQVVGGAGAEGGGGGARS